MYGCTLLIFCVTDKAINKSFKPKIYRHAHLFVQTVFVIGNGITFVKSIYFKPLT